MRQLVYALGAVGITVATVGCRQSPPAPPATEVVVVSAASVPEAPDDADWDKAPQFTAKLLVQDLVDPRLMQPSTGEVRVRAMTDAAHLAFRLEWDDASDDDVAGPAIFGDACAVQLPARIEPTVPAPQMGEPGRPVEIAYWSAVWQAKVNGRGDSIKDLHPNAAIDHYPFEAAPLKEDPRAQHEMAMRYAPARALGNLMAGPRDSPVQDLVAAGPGTLTPATSGASRGRGTYGDAGWSVVIVRPFPSGLKEAGKTQVALAVWQGAEREAGARKMRTGWIPLTLEAKP